MSQSRRTGDAFVRREPKRDLMLLARCVADRAVVFSYRAIGYMFAATALPV